MNVSKIAELLDLPFQGDPEREIDSAAALDSAGPTQVAYVESAQHLERAAASLAGCLILPEGMTWEGAGPTLLHSPHPKYHFARLAGMLHPRPQPPPGIHPTALVAPTAKFSEGVSVGPYAIVDEDVLVGRGSCISAYCHVGQGCELGEEVFLHPRVTLYPAVRLGARVIVHSGTVIGSDGFGYVQFENRHVKFPQLGRVEIEEDVEIGSNSSIDRGSLGVTRIGSGTKIDNLVQIAHNVWIGSDCIIAAQTGISGSATVEHHAILAGQVGIADHVRIEEYAKVGAQGGVPTGKTIRKREFVWGTPARPMEMFKEQYGSLSRLPRLRQEFSALKKRVAQLEALLENQPTTHKNTETS